MIILLSVIRIKRLKLLPSLFFYCRKNTNRKIHLTYDLFEPTKSDCLKTVYCQNSQFQAKEILKERI